MTQLTIQNMKQEASLFAEHISSLDNSEIRGATDGKAVGTYLERNFKEWLQEKYETDDWGNAAKGIDLPSVNTDIKFTSIKQPQSSLPYKSASQKVLGLGYNLLVFVYDKDDSNTQNIKFIAVSFIEAAHTADYQMTRQLLEAVKNDANDEDLFAILSDRNLPGDDFFTQKFENLFDKKARNLVVGNPPWVTASQLAQMNSSNVPKKRNIKNLSGFDALTGKSNFDIAEWITLRLLEELSNLTEPSALALLVKNSVVRNIAKYLPSSNLTVSKMEMYHFDAQKEFGVSTDASLMLIDFNGQSWNQQVQEFTLSEPEKLTNTFGWVNNHFVSNVEAYRPLVKFDRVTDWDWRSGVKHDVSKVMEFEKLSEGTYQNGLGEIVNLPDDYLYPLVKSSDVNKESFRKYVLITQHFVGEGTAQIREKSPKTWKYLQAHKSYFDKRKSSIYQKAPDYSIFGVGDYSFKPYKVAISGMYKNPVFRVLSPVNGKPVMVDDTVYFVGFDKKEDAEIFAEILNQKNSQNLLQTITFEDAKRPYTKDVLKRIDVAGVLRSNASLSVKRADFLVNFGRQKDEQLELGI